MTKETILRIPRLVSRNDCNQNTSIPTAIVAEANADDIAKEKKCSIM